MLQLVRETSIRILIQEAPSLKRGFLFYVSAGFSKEIDQQSGMSVRLNSVDLFLRELKSLLEGRSFSSFSDLMEVAWQYLHGQAQAENAVLSSLSFREHRGWGFFWRPTLASGDLYFEHKQYLEMFPSAGEIDLLQVRFIWHHKKGSTAAYQAAGHKILKQFSQINGADLKSFLNTQVGLLLDSKSRLESIQIDYLSENFSVQIP
jgi:hypothetical protein